MLYFHDACDLSLYLSGSCSLCVNIHLSSPSGLNSVIQTQKTVAAAVGEQACLNCLLIQTKEVLQVTWQKILPDRESNVITYDKYLKKLVNADFQGKVELIDAGLQNSSILIRNVTEEDEGCYRCMFNTYPDGALTATTCLKLYGQYLL
uniref:Ig-like domain-containing protein n=1 Tax=Labrus bergylta TaxID=56723 RepID=A0A3Q3G9J8_9LABR